MCSSDLVDGGSEDNFDSHLDRILEKLYLARERRVHPLRDDKLIVAWTGAMITTLATAAPVLQRPDWLQAAQRAATLVWQRNVDAAGRLHRIYLNNAVSRSEERRVGQECRTRWSPDH